MLKVGIAGCGTIGSYLAKNIAVKYKGKVKLTGVCEPKREKITALEKVLKRKIKSFSLSGLVKNSDLVIEAAEGRVVGQLLPEVIKYGKEAMLMSTGGLLLRPDLLDTLIRKKIRLYIPSGAIAGLDALKAAKMGRITSVKLTTRKPPAGLKGAPYIVKKKIALEKLKKDTIVFDGTAKQAVAGFPKNINVAAVLSLAGIGAARTRVCIVACPKIKRNTHTIEIEGNFGKILSCTENVPSQLNPKTSQLAVLSALATLDGILSPIKIGT